VFQNLLFSFLFLVSLNIRAEVIPMINPDSRDHYLAPGFSVVLYSSGFSIHKTQHDVIFHARTVLNIGASTQNPISNRVRVDVAVLNNVGAYFCGDSFLSNLTAFQVSGAISLAIPIQLQGVCKLNPGNYYLRATAINIDADAPSARLVNAIVDIR